MTIARPSHGVASNGKDNYRLNRLGGVIRPRCSIESPLLFRVSRVQQRTVGQQQTYSTWNLFNKSFAARRGLAEPCQASSVTTQATVIKVRFAFHHQVPFGQELKLVGGCPELGNWQSERAQELQWNEGHVWTGDFSLEPGSYEFKCVVASGDSILEWEPGANRILQVPGGVRGIRVEGSWSRTADNRVIVTEPIAAASVAARQKRAAAARLLTKALAQVNAAAAASGPASAAAAGVRVASREKAAAGAGAASGSGGGGDESKRSAAEALEQEALRELQALLSPGGSDAGAWTAAIPGDAKGGGSGQASGRKAATAAPGGSSGDSDSAAVGEASNGKVPGAHGNGFGLVAAGGERGANSSNSDKASGPSTSATASAAVEQSSQPAVSGVSSLGRSGGAGKARGWREAISESIDGARDQDQQQQQPQAREQQKEQEQRQPSASEATAASALAGGIAQSIREAAAARGEPVADRHDAASSVQQGASVGSGGPASVPEPDQRPRLAAAAKEQQQQPPVAKAAAKAEGSKAAAFVAASEAAEAKGVAVGKSAAAAEVKAAAGAAPVKESAAATVKAAAAAVAGPQDKEQKKAEASLPVSPVVSPAAAAAVQAAGVAAEPKAAAAAGVAPAARSGGSRLDKAEGVVSSPSDQQKQEVKQPAATQGGVIEASANAASGQDGAKVAEASSVVTAAESEAGDSSSKSSSSSSSSGGKARGLSWRQLLDDKEAEQPTAAKVKEQREPERKPVQGDKAPEEAQPAAKQGEDKGAASKVEQEKAEEEQGVSARFARLLASRLGGNKSQAPSPNAPAAAANTADKQVGSSKQASAKRPQEPLKKEASSSAAKQLKEPESAFAAGSVKASAPATPPGRDSKASAAPHAAAAPGNAASGQSSSSSSSVSGKDQGVDETAAGMGVGSSRDGRRVETLSNPDLDRIVDAWDAAWSKGRPKQEAGAAPSAPPASTSSSNTNNSNNDGVARVTTAASTKGGNSANGSAGRGGAAWPSLAAASGSGGSAPATNGRAPLPPSALTSALGGGAAAAGAASAAAAAGASGTIANGSPASGIGAAVGGSSGSGESLYSIAERLTGGNGPAAAAALPNGPSSAESSPGITVRLGAMAAMGVDRQGSFDNRSSYLSQSLLAESVSMSGSGAGSAEQPATALLRQLRAANAANAAKGANGAAATSVPNLPATPAPPGILSSVDDDDNGGVVPPLPATPPPPSYLSGPSGGGGGAAAAGAVPPLPATPVASSVLSGSLGGIGSAAEDLLRRAADADAVLNMLRGNLPLTPVARGGRGGAAGPLSMLEADEDEDDDESNGGAAGGRSRRGRRGAGQRRVPLLPIPGASTDAQADPLAAARAAAENTRAALKALQQGAAGLVLSPEALAESVARLQDILPKLDALGSQPGAASDGDAAGAPAPPGLPPAVSQLATNLVSSLGTVGSGLSDQLRRALGAAPPAAELTEAPSGETAVAAANGNGTTDVVAKANGGGGLLSGLLSSIVGVSGDLAPLPPGCVRLVAGAHMIPHVDKVDKGGEDAYFISRVGLGGVAVADGVSGWADEGIDPAEYPRTLMRYAADAYEMARGTMEARDIIRYAQYRTYLKGSSTVCMALMKPGRKLEVANVGDSGVRILRNGKVIFGTEAQQHSFNMPFQLSHPNNVEDPDSAEDADVQELDVQEGDVVMLATDGLFDNVFDEEIEQIVSAQLRELAAAGRGKQPAAAVTVTATAATAATAAAAAGTAATASNEAGGVANGGAANGASANGVGSSSSGAGSSGGGGGGRGGKGLLSQSFSAAAAAAAAASAGAAANGGAGGSGMSYRPEDAARVARALAERAHQHARNPTQRTPWSVTSSQQPNFMWAKFFAKGGGKMDDCTVLVAFVCGPE